jgi:carboxyl-terminal processing protease
MMYASAARGSSPAALPAPEGAREGLSEIEAALSDPPGPGRGELLDGETGYIPIRTFSRGVPSMVYGAIRDLEAQGMKTLILDLRDNPGGEVTAALELAGDFLPPGTPLGTLRDEDGDETEYRARPGTPYRTPLVVLVNRGTASSSELFAGCLQAHGRAVIVGERTHGKGVVQRVTDRGDDGAEIVSVATYLLPNGAEIQGVGVVPDVLHEARDGAAVSGRA